MKKLKFCFFGEVAGALRGKTVGGAQMQIALLAKALAMNGHEVVIVDPFSNESFVTPEGVKLVHVPAWSQGLPKIRMITHRIPALYQIFKEQKADYYYLRTRSYIHLAVYLAARKAGGKVLLAIASDIDVMNFADTYRYQYKGSVGLMEYLSTSLPGDLVFRYILKNADIVLLQHNGQKAGLPPVRGKVVLFPNIIDKASVPYTEAPSRDYFIHVGSLYVLKGIHNLDRLISLVDPSVKIMIVGRTNDQVSERIIKKFQLKSNVILKGQVGHTETLELISHSKALINTSNFEGFPNIFLEAWASGVPVISLNVNPGNVFSNHDLGVCCNGDVEKMKAFMEAGEVKQIARDGLVSYVTTHHDFHTAADRFLKSLDASTKSSGVLHSIRVT